VNESLTLGDRVILFLGFIVCLAVWAEYLYRVLMGTI
jgi:hypothetical protein